MKLYKNSNNDKESVLAGSFNNAANHMNTEPCGFITAFRKKDKNGIVFSHEENRRRNKQLEGDIKASGLSFYKANGGFIENLGEEDETEVSEDTFMIIDNKFPPKDFIRLMVYWCGKYDQDCVLVTIPDNVHKQPNKPINVIGRYYDANGNITDEYDHATVKDGELYFTELFNKKFTLANSSYYATKSYNIYGVGGRRLGEKEFGERYPELVNTYIE